MAHVCVYAALGFFVCGFLTATGLVARPKVIILLSLTFCFLYACSDEFHQGLVAGRGPAYTDVLIDSLGALLGIALQLALLGVKNAWMHMRNDTGCKTK